MNFGLRIYSSCNLFNGSHFFIIYFYVTVCSQNISIWIVSVQLSSTTSSVLRAEASTALTGSVLPSLLVGLLCVLCVWISVGERFRVWLQRDGALSRQLGFATTTTIASDDADGSDVDAEATGAPNGLAIKSVRMYIHSRTWRPIPHAWTRFSLFPPLYRSVCDCKNCTFLLDYFPFGLNFPELNVTLQRLIIIDMLRVKQQS